MAHTDITKKIEKIARVFTGTKGKVAMQKVVAGIFTEKEIFEIDKRIEIVRMLKKGIAQQKVAIALGVGVATVTRGAREIRLGRFQNL